ncbi:hypothetical protein FG167_05380 [Lacinutrix sp. WUR7]|uniref:hypothetical protein n=1 Tax=Lacinutrix sp. WUR7 TaxID=2653681 RepID=UPI00193E4A28|nr:hypothetical protein [Lacinutrix sp. WUR7]QRM88685.1 hypothetical protein FG167_05380 [Lacinutrix sp. WUR7]
MKIRFLIAIFILALTYSTNAQSDSLNKKETIGNFTYYEPIFIHHKPNKPNIIYQRFEEISVIALDSVFKGKKYKINEKYNLSLTNEVKNELIPFFNTGKKNKEIIEFTPNIKLVSETTNDHYGLFLLIKTKSSLSIGTAPISKIQLEIIVMDFSLNKVIFHEKSKNLSPSNNGGYAFTLIKNLDYIYKEMRKQ